MNTLPLAMPKSVICALVALSAPLAAHAQEACAPYIVKDGDSLGSIAQTAYGTFDYQIIFNANREVLAGNPNNLTAGLELKLPCKDGRLTADAELAAVITAEDAKQATAKKSRANKITAAGVFPCQFIAPRFTATMTAQVARMNAASGVST